MGLGARGRGESSERARVGEGRRGRSASGALAAASSRCGCWACLSDWWPRVEQTGRSGGCKPTAHARTWLCMSFIVVASTPFFCLRETSFTDT